MYLEVVCGLCVSTNSDNKAALELLLKATKCRMNGAHSDFKANHIVLIVEDSAYKIFFKHFILMIHPLSMITTLYPVTKADSFCVPCRTNSQLVTQPFFDIDLSSSCCLLGQTQSRVVRIKLCTSVKFLFLFWLLKVIGNGGSFSNNLKSLRRCKVCCNWYLIWL